MHLAMYAHPPCLILYKGPSDSPRACKLRTIHNRTHANSSAPPVDDRIRIMTSASVAIAPALAVLASPSPTHGDTPGARGAHHCHRARSSPCRPSTSSGRPRGRTADTRCTFFGLVGSGGALRGPGVLCAVPARQCTSWTGLERRLRLLRAAPRALLQPVRRAARRRLLVHHRLGGRGARLADAGHLCGAMRSRSRRKPT